MTHAHYVHNATNFEWKTTKSVSSVFYFYIQNTKIVRGSLFWKFVLKLGRRRKEYKNLLAFVKQIFLNKQKTYVKVV